MKFGPWEIPETPKSLSDFAKRLDAASKIKKQQIKLISEEHAYIQGSGVEPYDVTFQGCTCMDFARGAAGIPCKHMIRLAMENGSENTFPEYDKDRAALYDFEADCKHLIELWTSGILSSATFSKLIGSIADAEKDANIKKHTV